MKKIIYTFELGAHSSHLCDWGGGAVPEVDVFKDNFHLIHVLFMMNK